MSTQTITPSAEPLQHTDNADDPFELNITFIENTPSADTVLMCSTGDNCGTSCPSACPTS
ncbi:FxLD family lanthipeptide [Streptosporangium sp. V21-05]|uniref:FxLD family lanthipeptide n=1 Tax=Streptosporangium sp. V21-05 TaxID=3446115 RepID=UPI003F5349A5